MEARRQLGELLKARRSHLRPEDVGLAATARRPRARRSAPERVTPALRQLVAALGDVPALLVGRRLDVLLWNAAGHALFAGHVDLSARPNMLRLLFLDEHTRELYVDWPAKARAAVAMLRASTAQHADDPLLAALVGELSVASPEFSALWANLDAGTLLRIPLRHKDSVQVRATGLTGVDDFAFTGVGDEVVATLNAPNEVVRVSGDGRAERLLTGADGLRNPTSVAVRGRTAHVLSAAYLTKSDPNLLRVRLPRR